MSVRARERVKAAVERRRTRPLKFVVETPAAWVRAAPSREANQLDFKLQGETILAASRHCGPVEWLLLEETFCGAPGYMLTEVAEDGGKVTILREVGIGAAEASYASSSLPMEYLAHVLGKLDLSALRAAKAVCRLWADEARCLLNDTDYQAEHISTAEQLRLYCHKEDWPSDTALVKRLQVVSGEAAQVLANAPHFGWLPIHLAVHSRRSCEVITALLKAHPPGAYATISSWSRLLPLHLAALNDSLEFDALAAVLDAFPLATQQSAMVGIDLLPVAMCARRLHNHNIEHFQLLMVATIGLSPVPPLHPVPLPAGQVPLQWFEEHIGDHLVPRRFSGGGIEQIRVICAQACPGYEFGVRWASSMASSAAFAFDYVVSVTIRD